MQITALITRPLYWLAGKVFALWARPAVQPEAPYELVADSESAVCYVLETGGLADLLALERVCELHGLPSPTEPMEGRTPASRQRYPKASDVYWHPWSE